MPVRGRRRVIAYVPRDDATSRHFRGFVQKADLWRGSCRHADVECRIEVARDAAGVLVLLAGRLRDAQVPDFLQTCANVGRPLRIDLTELISADAVGLEALLRVRNRGAVLQGVPEYLHLKIESLARERALKPSSSM